MADSAPNIAMMSRILSTDRREVGYMSVPGAEHPAREPTPPG
jgi:hypothetical protein